MAYELNENHNDVGVTNKEWQKQADHYVRFITNNFSDEFVEMGAKLAANLELPLEIRKK